MSSASSVARKDGSHDARSHQKECELLESDALIVKSYGMSASEMQLGALIGGGFAVVEESKTR